MNNSEFDSIVILAGALFTTPQFELNPEQFVLWRDRLRVYDKDEVETAIKEAATRTRFLTLDVLCGVLRDGRRATYRKNSQRIAEENERRQKEQAARERENSEMMDALNRLPAGKLEWWHREIIRRESGMKSLQKLPPHSSIWIPIIYARAILGVVHIIDKETGRTVEVEVQEYWRQLEKEPQRMPVVNDFSSLIKSIMPENVGSGGNRRG